MAQVFGRRFGFMLQLGALAALLLLAVVGFAWRLATAYPAGRNDALEQPVPFSHKHHVGDDGIDCRYCHSAVESSAFAGIPPLSTCMTCHSQLYTDQGVLAPLLAAYRSGVAFHWERLHKLPDFVYFNHSVHIAKGVGCVTCHGQVDDMALTERVAPLTMQWCLDCHRDPAPNLRPRDQVFNQHWQSPNVARGPQLLRAYHIDTRRLADCSLCHR